MTDKSHDPSLAYYGWRRANANTRRGAFAVYSKPGMARFEKPDPAAMLLADEIEVDADDVLVLNCGGGLPGMVAAAAGARVAMLDANVVAVSAAQRSAEANELADRIRVSVSGGTRELAEDLTFDRVALLLPKGKAVALQAIWDAYHALKPRGRFYIAGANAEGAKSYFRYAEELYGALAVRGYRKGCRVGEARRPEVEQPVPARFREPWLDHDYFCRFDVQVDALTLRVRSRPGVFSWDRLDAGTRALLDVLEIDAADRVLDLGCGCGIIGTVAAMMAPQGQVLMLDADMNAVVSARRTLAANDVANASVELSDCAAVVKDDCIFDVVVTNPPFHQGKATQYDVAYQFIRDAARMLKPNGRFYLVANRFLPYESEIRRQLGRVDTIYEDGRFKVLLGRQAV